MFNWMNLFVGNSYYTEATRLEKLWFLCSYIPKRQKKKKIKLYMWQLTNTGRAFLFEVLERSWELICKCKEPRKPKNNLGKKRTKLEDSYSRFQKLLQSNSNWDSMVAEYGWPYWLMEKKWEPRNKPTYLLSTGFWEKMPTSFNGKRIDFPTNGQPFFMQKNEVESLPYTSTKLNQNGSKA